MSIYGALISGVSGMAAQSQAMGMISDNITNVNTVGYKETNARFSTLVAESATTSAYTPGGVKSTPNTLVEKQGLMQPTVSPYDLAINGEGFMVVTETSTVTTDSREFLTRAGAFMPDVDGYLKNAGGYYLRGWTIDDTTGAVSTSLATVNVANFAPTTSPTTSVAFQANLKASQTVSTAEGTYAGGVSATNMASGNVTADFSRSIEIYDSQGTPRTLTLAFLKSSTANQWHAEVYVEPPTITTGVTDGQVMRGTVAFNTDGTWDLANTSWTDGAGTALTATGGDYSVAIPFDSTTLGIAAQTVSFDWGTDTKADGMTQYDGTSTMVSFTADGAAVGQVSAISLDDTGVLTAVYTNGLQKETYKLPVATVPNPNGLGPFTGNAFGQTAFSGNLTYREAGTGGSGLFAPSSLESSTVDLANEFSKMILSQRAFSAATRIIRTSDEMLEELIRVKR